MGINEKTGTDWLHIDTCVRLYVYINTHIFRNIKRLDMYIFMCYRYSYVCRCICLSIYTCMWDVCMCEKRRGRQKERQGNVSLCMYVCAYLPLFDPGIHRRQNKNHTPAASRQSEIYLHSLLSPGRWMGPIWSPFTRSTMEWRRRRHATQTCTNLRADGFGRCYLGNPGGIT